MRIAKIAVALATFAIDKPYQYCIPNELEEALQPGMRVMVPFGRGNKRSEGIVLAITQKDNNANLKNILAILDDRPVLDQHGIQLALWLRERYFSTLYTAVLTMLPTGLWYTLRDRYRIAPELDRETAFGAVGKSQSAQKVLQLLFSSGGVLEFGQLVGIVDIKNPKPLLTRLVRDGILILETGAERKVKDKTEKVATLRIPPQEAMEAVSKRQNSAPMRYAVTQLLSAIGSASVKELRYFTGASLSTLRSLEKSGILLLEEQEVFRRAVPEFGLNLPDLQLNEAQQIAANGLEDLCKTGKAEAALLYGVTGSGKTQVYLKLIHSVLSQGKTALVLVPEIALTTKLLELFLLHFREQVAILHSALPAGERYDEWKRIRDGKAKVVLGTRSAVFAPLQQLGLIVMDEEQEGSYQSESMLRYHARDVAKFRCMQNQALLLLGSATPAVETMYYAQRGNYHLFTLNKRFNERSLPAVYIVDMKSELQRGNQSGLSASLLQELEENFARGEQSILFLNRRGSNRMVACGECGEVPSCPRCSVYLSYHSVNGRLMCHHCGFSKPLPSVCPQCGGTLQFLGLGTQRIEAELNRLYPEIEVMRMDTDNITATRSHEALLDQFQRKKVPILVGTQMVAADLSLYVNSFRASERTFSLLTQVVGRAGRGEKPGRAILQTWTPDHEIITLAAKQDYDNFYIQECEMRSMRRFPPFGDLFRITVSGPDEAAVLRVCMNLRSGMERWREQRKDFAEPPFIFGPAPANVLKVNNRYRYHLTLNDWNKKETRAWIAQLLRLAQSDPATRGLSITADLNLMD
jgi:primosomal protein N' (replication factor Y)